MNVQQTDLLWTLPCHPLECQLLAIACSYVSLDPVKTDAIRHWTKKPS